MMYLHVQFLSLTLLLMCVCARDIVVDKNDERIQRYLKNYRRTSATVERNNRHVVVPYRGRFTGGSYSYSNSYNQRTKYQTGLNQNEVEQQKERERLQAENLRKTEKDRLQREREQQQRERSRQEEERERARQEEMERARQEQERLRQEQERQRARQEEEKERARQQEEREKARQEEMERARQEQERARQEQERTRQETERKAQQERADRERRHEESQRAIERRRLEREREARTERQRRIEIERRQREQLYRQKQETEQRRKQEEYERALREQQAELEKQAQRRREEEENRLRQTQERARQEEERRRQELRRRQQETMEEERRRQQHALEEERRRQQEQAQRNVAQGQTQGPADLNYIRTTLRGELETIVREMRNQYEDSISGRNMLAAISRQLEGLLQRLDVQMQQNPSEDTRNVKQQLEYWMRRLEGMAREDTFDCDAAEREIKALKGKVDYMERLIVHQGYSRGSQYRRSTTPRPPTVPDRSDSQQPPAVTLQRPAEDSQRWDQRQQQQQHTGHSQGSWRNSHVDKWLPATRERYNTRMAASKDRERHISQRQQESQRRADALVRGLMADDKKPWKPHRGRRPSKGLTGLLDRRVIQKAEVDPLDAIWIEEHNAPHTIAVDSPGTKYPDWLIRQGQRQSSHRRNQMKQINVYHQDNGRKTGADDSRLHGDRGSNRHVIDYQGPPQPQAHTRKKTSVAATCPAYVDGLEAPETVRRVSEPMIGSWMKDTARFDPRIFAVEESNALHWDELLEYSNEDDFIKRRLPTSHKLPERCSGLGAVVYNGDLYCQVFSHSKKNKPNIVRIRLYGDVLISRAELPGKHVGTKGWAGAYMSVQLSADSSGIWAIFAGEDELLNIFQLDTNLNKLQGWRTTVAKNSVGPAFMVCGVMYAFDSHYANNIAYIYDTGLSQGRHLTSNRIVMPFKDMATVHYNPTDSSLYMWTLVREEYRNIGYSKYRFTSRSMVFGVAERLLLKLSGVRVHM